MKRTAPACVLAAFAGLSGCYDSDSKDETEPAPLVRAGFQVRVEQATRFVQVAARRAAESAETVAGVPPGRALFDGDTRASQGLEAAPVVAAASAAPPFSGYSGQARSLKSQTEPPEPDVPPQAGTLRGGDDVSLPTPRPGAGPKGGGPVLRAYDAFQRALYRSRFYPDLFALVSRAGWGARPSLAPHAAQSPTRVTVHHTRTPPAFTWAETARRVRSVQRYHMYGRARAGKEDFDDIGYHFLIDGAGRVVEGRPTEEEGAHVQGSNPGNVGIALIGDFNKIRPSPAQVRSLERLVSFLAVKYRIDPAQPTFLEPHRHFDSRTSCPGANVVTLLGLIRRGIAKQTLKDLEDLRLISERLLPDGKPDFEPVIALGS